MFTLRVLATRRDGLAFVMITACKFAVSTRREDFVCFFGGVEVGWWRGRKNDFSLFLISDLALQCGSVRMCVCVRVCLCVGVCVCVCGV